MAAVLLFRDTNMVAGTSRENSLFSFRSYGGACNLNLDGISKT